MIRRLRDNPAWQARLDIGLRVAAATIGGYFFTYACTAAMARLLPLARFDAVMVSSLLAFAVYTAVIVWVFAAASAWRAWLGIALALPLAIIGFWPGLFGSGA